MTQIHGLLSMIELIHQMQSSTHLAERMTSLKHCLEILLEQSYGIFNGKARHTAKLKFTPFRAQWVAKELWHPKQRGRFEPNGAYILEVPYGNDTELLMDILKQGPEVEVLEPKVLRERVAAAIAATNHLYQA